MERSELSSLCVMGNSSDLKSKEGVQKKTTRREAAGEPGVMGLLWKMLPVCAQTSSRKNSVSTTCALTILLTPTLCVFHTQKLQHKPPGVGADPTGEGLSPTGPPPPDADINCKQ